MNQQNQNPFEQLDAKLDTILIELRHQNHVSSDELLSIDDAAKLLSLSKATLYGYTHRGTIPFKRRNRKLYFSKTDLIDWLNKEKQFDATTLLKRKGGAEI